MFSGQISLTSQEVGKEIRVNAVFGSGLRLSYSNLPQGTYLYAAFEFPLQTYAVGSMPTSSQVGSPPSLGQFKSDACWVMVANKTNILPSTPRYNGVSA